MTFVTYFSLRKFYKMMATGAPVPSSMIHIGSLVDAYDLLHLTPTSVRMVQTRAASMIIIEAALYINKERTRDFGKVWFAPDTAGRLTFPA